MSKQSILNPIKVGNSNLQHRVVLAPLTRNRASIDAAPTDLQVEYYKQRASEGSLLITEATFIHRLAGGYKLVPGIYNKEQIGAWKKVTSAVHEKKGVIFLQIWHIGHAGSRSLNPNEEQPVSASEIAVNGQNFLGGKYEVHRALEIDELKEIVQQFRQAALNAFKTGFDGVEINSANGYLLDQFTNTSSNKRIDIYGGSIENGACFTLEVVDAVTDAIGAERTGIRFSPNTDFQDMHDETPVETWSYLITEIQKKYPNFAYVHMIDIRSNVFTEDVSTIDTLESYRQIWKGPFISASGFSTATTTCY